MALHKFILPESKFLNHLFYVLLSVVTVIMIFSMTYLEIDSDVTKLLPENKDTIAEKSKILEMKKDFPSPDSSIFIAVEFETMDDEKFALLKKMCKELENLSIHDTKIVSSILSPFNAVYFKKAGNTFIPRTVYSGSSYASQEKNTDAILENRYISGSVLAYDMKSTGILVNMNENAVIKGREKLTMYHYIGTYLFGKNYGDKLLTRNRFSSEVEKVYSNYKDHFSIYTAGVPIYEAKSRTYMIRDIMALLIPAILMMLIVLYFNFRSIRGILLPIAGMVLSLIWTLGLMSILRQPLTVVGILIPPIVLTIGSSYTLHYINSYYLHSAEKDRKKLVVSSTKAIFPTISMAAVTTIIGFASFFTARMNTIRSFGFWIVVSIMFTLFFTFFLLSKMLIRLHVPEEKHLNSVNNDHISVFLKFIHKIVLPNYPAWILLFFVAIILFAFTIKNINIETNAINFFKPSDPVKKSMVYMQKNYKGTLSFNVTVRSTENKKDFFRTREGLLLAEEIERFIENNPGVDGNIYTGWKMSPVSMLQDINKVVTGETGIPEDQNLIDRFFNLILASRNPLISSIVKNDLSAINIQVRTYSDKEKVGYVITEQELAQLNSHWNQAFREFEAKNPSIRIETWGEMLLLSKVSKYLYEDQIGSLTFTLIFILITTLILFRSFYYALISTIPLLFGILMNFSIMSLFGISLDVATIMIGAISVGVGIDSSLHFILNYRRSLNTGLSTDEALEYTLTYTSRPILFASLALMAGFIVFLLSTFRPVFFFGLLISITMLNCTFATLLILPSFIKLTEKLNFRKKNKLNRIPE